MGWQMIKITVDAQVYEALQKAFPKPANTAHRALAKYISVLEATHQANKLRFDYDCFVAECAHEHTLISKNE